MNQLIEKINELSSKHGDAIVSESRKEEFNVDSIQVTMTKGSIISSTNIQFINIRAIYLRFPNPKFF